MISGPRNTARYLRIDQHLAVLVKKLQFLGVLKNPTPSLTELVSITSYKNITPLDLWKYIMFSSRYGLYTSILDYSWAIQPVTLTQLLDIVPISFAKQ